MAGESNDEQSLGSYLQTVERVVERMTRETALPADQIALMLSESRPAVARSKPLAHPVAPFYFVARAHGVRLDAASVTIAAAFVLLHHALGLADNTQDDELSGAHAQCGPAVASNCAMTLFFIAVDGLNRAAVAAGGTRGTQISASLRTHALRLAGGQHRDLSERGTPVGSAEARATAIEKSAIFSLLIELAALCAGAGDAGALAPEYRVVGDCMAEIHQLTDDVADLFCGNSDDIRTQTWNVPLALLFETLSTEDRAEWITRLPSAERLRPLLYSSGAIQQLAQLTERARQQIHECFATLPCDGPYLALLLAWLDDLVSVYYRPPALLVASDVDAPPPRSMNPHDAALLRRLQGARHWRKSA